MTRNPETPDEIEPMIPMMPRSDLRADGGTTPPREAPTTAFDRPPRTDHATEYTRGTEEIEPGVPDLR